MVNLPFSKVNLPIFRSFVDHSVIYDHLPKKNVQKWSLMVIYGPFYEMSKSLIDPEKWSG